MKWLKENCNWYVIFGLLMLTAWLGVVWMMNENGSVKAWAAKPFSQATLGDIASIVIIGAILVRK